METQKYGAENLEERVVSPKEIQDCLNLLERNKIDKETYKVSDLYHSQVYDLACKARGIFVKNRTMHFPKIQNQESAKMVFSELMKADPYTPRIVLGEFSKKANAKSEKNEEPEESVNEVVTGYREKINETMRGSMARRKAGEKMLREKIKSGEVIMDK